MGFVDTVAPPVGIWTAFNQIKGPKEAAPMFDSPHNNMASQQQQLPFTRRSAEWLSSLGKGEEVKPDERMARPKTASPEGPAKPSSR
jgi:cephalosporin-C deacetylase